MAGNDKLARGDYLSRKLRDMDPADPQFPQLMEELENIIRWSRQRQEELKREEEKTEEDVDRLRGRIERREQNKENK